MLEFLKGRRPDITAAQIAAVPIAFVPGLTTSSALLAAVLIGGDAALRSTRNLADARTDAAAMVAGEPSPLAPETDLQDAEADFEEDEGPVVSDEEEFFAESELRQLEAGMTAENPDYVSDGR